MWGVRLLIVSKSLTFSLTPVSLASEIRWRTALVEPPIAFTIDIAFSNASKLKISRGLISLSINASNDFPVNRAISVLLSLSAGGEEQPGNDIPRASLTEAIVFAVYIPPQDPADGHAAFSKG